MSELQASVEFSIELHKFYNVDLFQRGFYQIRVGLKVSPRLSVKTEVHITRNSSRGGEHVYPACIANPFGVSNTFQILYRNEEVQLDNVFMFRSHILVDSHRIEDTLDRAEFALQMELWFSEQPISHSASDPNQQNSICCASVRTLQMEFTPAKGLHYHLPVLFDYFHLAAVTVTIHGTLVALHQPYIKKSIFNYVQSCTPRSARPLFSSRFHSRYLSGKADLIFFQNLSATSKCVGSSSGENRIAHARHVHQEVCSLLLAAYETLQTHLHQFMKLLPAWQQLKLESTDFFNRLNNLSDFAKACHTKMRNESEQNLSNLGDEDFLSVANSDIAQLCAENMLLWQQFLETFTCKEPVNQHLAKVHHQLRVKRFAEAFFVMDNPRKSAAGCYDANCQNYLAVAEAARRSRYLATLPNLPITCVELDGDLASLPIIFEDQYQDVAEFARRRSNASAKKSGSDSFLNVFGEKGRPRLGNEEDCNCGIVAILESRSRQIPSRSATLSTPSLRQKSMPLTTYGIEGDVLKASLTLAPVARHSHSLDQLGGGINKPTTSDHFPTNNLVGLTSFDFSSSVRVPRLTHSASSLTVVNDSDREDNQTLSLLFAQSSESLPNLAPLMSSNNSSIATIAEELPSQNVELSSDSSVSEDVTSITSEQSGWVSNSSRRCSSSSSSPVAFSPDSNNRLPDYSTLRVLQSSDQNLLLTKTPLDGDYLIEKLEKLALRGSLPKKNLDDCALLPPKQFRDIPPPPEAFRDPPVSFIQSDRVMEKLLSELCVDNGSKDVKRKSRRLRGKSHYRQRASVSDEGFAELDTLRGDSDTSTIESISEIFVRDKNPFEGYLFKEDIETLKKTYEAEKNETMNQPKTTVSNGLNDGDDDENNDDCQCYDEQNKLKKYEDHILTFIKAKEEFKRQMNFTGMIYSDFPTLASTLPYFHISDEYRIFSPEGLHLIICVHGLDGNSADLRLVKTYLELGLPGANLEFLMSERNQGDTFSDFDTMTDKLVAEILYHIDSGGLSPAKISFIGHSLGNIIIRSAVTRPQMKHLLPKFHTFLSLSGPHLGTLYNNSGLVNMGMWFMQKWKKSRSLLQLSLRDTADLRKSFLYRLSQKSNLQAFRHVLLCGSSQDRYVPMHSARIELCKAAIKDITIQGAVYREMVHNIMYPVISSSDTTLVRYDIHHALPNTANSIIGRAAHIAVLDSELFIEKFLVVTGLKYFR